MAERKRPKKVGDIYYGVEQKGNETANFLRNPIQVTWQWGRQQLQQVGEWVKSRDVPEGRQSQNPVISSPLSSVEQRTLPKATATTVRVREAPASLPVTSHQVLPDADQGSFESLPVWNPKEKPLTGSRWDRYTVGNSLQQGDGFRLWEARKSNDEPVLIKEYLLRDRGFEHEEIAERQQAFGQLVNLNLTIGNGPDFRVVKLIDAFVDTSSNSRCFLVTKPIVDSGITPVYYSKTLAAYLADQKALTAGQIREILRQVLETLRFLHTYRIRFSIEQSEQGIPHGNISLTSLRIRQSGTRGVSPERQFFIYVTDLALWEHLFFPPGSQQFHAKIANTASDLVLNVTTSQGTVEWQKEDLKDLGLVAFRLAGQTINLRASQLPDFQTEHPLSQLRDEPLVGFMHQLIGLKPPFKTAEEALHALLQPDDPQPGETRDLEAEKDQPQEASPSAKHLLLPAMLILLFFVGLGAIPLFFVNTNKPKPDKSGAASPDAMSIAKAIPNVKNVPTSINYLIEPGGAWDFALQRTFVLPGQSEKNLNLMRYSEQRYQSYKSLRLNHCSVGGSPNRNNLGESSDLLHTEQCTVSLDQSVPFLNQLESILTGSNRDLAILTQLPEKLSEALDKKAVAYDALVVFTQFRDAYSSETVLKKLGEYSISLGELRRLYTGDTDTPELRNGQKIKLFFPDRQADGDYASWLFEKLVLKSDPELIRKFHALEGRVKSRENAAGLSTRRKDIYARIASNSEVGIGFDRLGRMFNQCSVYPLAIGEKSQAVQVLVKAGGKPIDEKSDLCSTKGSYWFDVSRYPLKYELGVVFRKDSEPGKKLAEILTTTEGQYLMSEVGLVPQVPVQNLWKDVWGEKHE